jgi:hypothetical protein
MSASARVEAALTRNILAVVAALGLLAPSISLQAAVRIQTVGAVTPAVDVTRLGPQVGEKVPDFHLPDQRGQVRTLSSLMGPKGLVLVFIRSADW